MTGRENSAGRKNSEPSRQKGQGERTGRHNQRLRASKCIEPDDNTGRDHVLSRERRVVHFPLPANMKGGPVDFQVLKTLEGVWTLEVADLQRVETMNAQITDRTVDFMLQNVWQTWPVSHGTGWNVTVSMPVLDFSDKIRGLALDQLRHRKKGVYSTNLFPHFPSSTNPCQVESETIWLNDGARAGGSKPHSTWWDPSINPASRMHVPTTLQEKVKASGNLGLQFHWTDATYTMCVFHHAGHFQSLVVSFPESIGLAWALCCDPSSASLQRAYDRVGKFAICVGDSLNPSGADRTFLPGDFVFHLCSVILQMVAMSYNHLVALGQIKPHKRASPLVDFQRQQTTFHQLLGRSAVMLPCHLQG